MLDEEMTIDNFLELYLPKRQTAIGRRVKVDKLKELLPPAGGGYRPPPSSLPAPYPPSAAPTPYPAAPYGGAAPYPPSSGLTPYPAAGPYAYTPPQPAMPYPYMPGGMPLPRY